MIISKENKNFLIYLFKYLGVAIISGSVVHIGTLHNNFFRYLILLSIGLILMLVGNIYESIENGQKINLKYLFILTGLSLSTGFISGGIQHYLDNPIYTGYLLSIGLFGCYLTFFWKEKMRLITKNIIIIFIISIIIFILSNFIIADIINYIESHSQIINTNHSH